MFQECTARFFRRLALVFLLSTGPSFLASATAAVPDRLLEAVSAAIERNPEVEQRWQRYLQAEQDREEARGRYYPELDFDAFAGKRWWDPESQPEERFDERRLRLSLRQMIYDGFATRSAVEKFSHAMGLRRLQLMDAVNNAALEAVRAYLDVARYRDLVALAEDNLKRHQELAANIKARVKRGVSSRVDMEQADARIGLAKSNLLTEKANLHDVAARYQRVVGSLPPKSVKGFAWAAQVPDTVREALRRAYHDNPGLLATLEDIQVAQYAIEEERARYHPRLDLVASTERGWDVDGVFGSEEDHRIGLQLHYNLFRGGSDRARIRRAAHKLNESQDKRDAACRNLRQTLEVAFNNLKSLGEQAGYLKTHARNVALVRDSYLDQFRIGRRSLLDLLDTQNEYFQARRAYINARYDMEIARARTLAAMGGLLRALGVEREGLPEMAGPEVREAELCPMEAPPRSTLRANAR